MKIAAIIQARMGSTRLSGKVLKIIEGETMLAHVVRRAQQSTMIHQFVIATTESPADDAIVAEAKRLGCDYFRGSEEDVLDRYYQSARCFRADAVVRITSDCPLADAGVIDEVICAFLTKNPDYAANNFKRMYPLGLDTEIVTFDALERTWQKASEPYQRSHVTYYMEENPEQFKLLSVVGAEDYSRYRWTVDTAEDLLFVRTVYNKLKAKGPLFDWLEVIGLLKREPELIKINAHINQKPVEQG